MYELQPLTIKTFIEDSTIRLPRFQRKPTWGPQKDFELCLSLFRGYPMGMVVIKREEADEPGATVIRKYLLDGRQRRDALSRMRNPEEIYAWAKRALRIRNKHSEHDIRELYLEYVDDYFGAEDWERTGTEASTDHLSLDLQSSPNSLDVPDSAPDVDIEAVDEAEDIEAEGLDLGVHLELSEAQDKEAEDLDLGVHLELSETAAEREEFERQHPSSEPMQFQGLRDLLDLILLVHPKRKRRSGFTEAFDFSRWVEGLDYMEKDAASGKLYPSAPKLLLWLENRKQLAALADQAIPPSEDDFYSWLTENKRVRGTEGKLRNALNLRWPKIVESFRLLDVSEKRMQDSRIGVLEIRKCTANDEKKIFEIINTKGTPLTAAEILSAKPAWNELVKDPAPSISSNVRQLYNDMALPLEDDSVRRWDVAATLLDRLDADFVLGDALPFSSRNFEKKVTFGFRLTSGYYQDRISKNDIERLAKLSQVPWGTLDLEWAVNSALEALRGDDFFKFWLSWKTVLVDLMSDAVAMNFLLVITRDWTKKDRPMGGAKRQLFIRNARVLLDSLIWEYCTGRWRGSGDSRIASNLASLEHGPDALPPVDEGQWRALLTEVIDEGRVEDRSYLDEKSVNPRVRLLLYYYYALRPLAAPPGKGVDVDHIIPESLFNQSPNGSLRQNRHHIANLELLALEDNRKKLDKTLESLSSDWLKQQVHVFSEIPIADFPRYSTVENSDDLIGYRGKRMKEQMLERRKDLLTV